MKDTFGSGAFPTLRSLSSDRRSLVGLQWRLLVAATTLTVIGLVTVHSASAELAVDHLPRQASWFGLGLLVCLLMLVLDYQRLAATAVPLYFAGLGLLVLVLFVGREGGGARSWIGVGPLGFQPSELAKLATILLLARFLAEAGESHLTYRHIFLAVLATLAPMALLVLQPDLGGAVMFLPMLGAMLIVAGLRARIIVGALIVGVLAGALLWTFGMKDYQRQRVRTFLSPGADPLGAGYQVRQSKIAVGSGGLHGRGYMQGTQSQLRFLPARHTDFIFAVLAEEWGFLGVASVLFLFGLYLSGAAAVAARARDRTGILLVTGLWSFFAFHVLYNTAMVVGLVPITGIPLPFLSYGGSFMLFNFAATGLILGVDYRRYVNR